MRLGTAIECLVDNYKYASDKEWINDKVAWALYHTWKVADRKTENSSEKPNNCETCKHYKLTCDLFSEICKYEPKDEPTISKTEQVDKDINVRSKTEQTERSE